MAKGESLEELARKKWRSSGLTDTHAKKLRYEVITAAQVNALGKKFGVPFLQAGAILLPYFTVTGKKSNFFRLRYLTPPAGSFAGALEKPPRYAQPAGTINEVYLPPLLDAPWEAVLADSKITLYITEGEFKSACACVNGLPTIGLGGVDMWKATKRMLDMLPALKDVDWDERDVVIVYDSDAANNPNVVRAQTALASALLNLGAKPRIASLPATKDGKKQGLDDFIVANGADALEKVLSEAPGTPEAIALWSMNQKVAYVRNPGMILELSSGRLMTSDAFTKHAYANVHYQKAEKNKEGETYFKPAKLAPRWLEWEHRYELECITYAPGKAAIDEGRWNTWRGWGCEPAKSSAKDVKPFYELLEYLCYDEDPSALRWFLRWLAYPLQHPGTKLFTSVLIWGGQGVGKSLIGRTMIRIYGDNASVVTSKHLQGSFNSWAANKQFVVGEEITGSDRREAADLLKNLITQHEIIINRKYEPEYVVPDCVNYYFNSNHPDAFFMEDDDRRNGIFHAARPPIFMHSTTCACGCKKKSEAFYREYDKWMKGDGPKYLFDHLLKLDLGDFSPTAPAIETNAKRAMIMTGKSDLGSWCVRLREDAPLALRAVGNEMKARECDLFTSEELRRAYDPELATKVTSGGMAKELSRSGFRQVNGGNPVVTANGRVRLFAVRNADRWVKAKLVDVTNHYNRFTGKKF